MKVAMIVLVLVLAVGGLVWLLGGSGGAPAKPATPTTPTTSPSAGIADAISGQMDAGTKSKISVQITSMRNDLKQTLARDPLEGDGARAQLQTYDELVTQVANAREELKTRGMSEPEIDAWLAKCQWSDAQELARKLRDRLASAPAQ